MLARLCNKSRQFNSYCYCRKAFRLQCQVSLCHFCFLKHDVISLAAHKGLIDTAAQTLDCRYNVGVNPTTHTAPSICNNEVALLEFQMCWLYVASKSMPHGCTFFRAQLYKCHTQLLSLISAWTMHELWWCCINWISIEAPNKNWCLPLSMISPTSCRKVGCPEGDYPGFSPWRRARAHPPTWCIV